MSDVATQVADMSVRASPAIAVTGFTIFGFQLPDIVSALTIVYLVVNVGYIVNKWIKGK